MRELPPIPTTMEEFEAWRQFRKTATPEEAAWMKIKLNSEYPKLAFYGPYVTYDDKLTASMVTESARAFMTDMLKDIETGEDTDSIYAREVRDAGGE